MTAVIAMMVGQERTKLLVAWRNGKVADRTCRFTPRRPDQKTVGKCLRRAVESGEHYASRESVRSSD